MPRKKSEGITVDGRKAARLVKSLGIKKTPDRKPRTTRTPRTRGVKTGLGICDFWCNLFAANELLPKKRKMTDEEIKRQVIEEFPKRDSVKKLGLVGERGTVTVNEHRLLYNRGRYTRNVVPVVRSVRYNSDGIPVDGKTGRRALSGQELFEFDQKRYEDGTW